MERKAFTIIELVFVIVILGILAAIALPKMQGTMETAYDASAKNTVAAVRSAISTLRQKKILRGDFSGLTTGDLGENFKNVLEYDVKSCTETGCGGWETNNDGTYTFHAPNGQDVIFRLSNNKLVCSSDAEICKKYEN